MLKKVNENIKGLLENNWIMKNRDPIPKNSFLKTETVEFPKRKLELYCDKKSDRK